MKTSVISTLDLAEQASEALKLREGFTLNPETGETATKGYAVSIPEAEMRTRFFPSPEIISAWLETHALRLVESNRHNGEGFIGGWHDKGDGAYYLDVSVIVESEEQAKKLGKAWNQIAVFDLNQSRSILL